MKHLKNILTAATLVAAAGSASAIQFDLAPAYFTPGSGYSAGGVSSLTQLGVDFFADTTLSRSFVLASGSSDTFKFGTVTLNDSELVDGFARIGFLELDNLGVTATFSFTNPTSNPSVGVDGEGDATFGLIDPRRLRIFGRTSVLEYAGEVDFSINWDPLDVYFGPGNSGMFTIQMDDISFDANGQTVDQNYRIEMVTAPIPEPETYALMLAGLGLVGFMARRRKQA
jgi:hypothetical protein